MVVWYTVLVRVHTEPQLVSASLQYFVLVHTMPQPVIVSVENMAWHGSVVLYSTLPQLVFSTVFDIQSACHS
jgi:hypothetical protein